MSTFVPLSVRDFRDVNATAFTTILLMDWPISLLTCHPTIPTKREVHMLLMKTVFLIVQKSQARLMFADRHHVHEDQGHSPVQKVVNIDVKATS